MAQGDIIQMIPTGSVYMFPVNSVLPGYLECNGATVSRTTYAALFAVIGITYGSGDGSTTFELPDLRGEFVRGWDHGKGTDSGRDIGTNQSEDTKAHNHTASSNSTGSHSHSLYNKGSSNCGLGSIWGVESLMNCNNHGYARSGAIVSSGNHSHTITVNDSTGDETRPRNVALMYCIKT